MWRKGETVVLKAETSDGIPATIEFHVDAAQRAGLALIAAGDDRIAGDSMFAETAALTVPNPPIEIRRSDTGSVFLAYRAPGFRPFVIQLDAERAQALAEALSTP